jgi:short-subunit dehydrogenase
MNKILIVGATSAIAEATARLYAEKGAHLFLVARNAQRLEAVAADLRTRGAASVDTEAMDANSCDRHEALVERADQALGGIDLALIAHGTLPDQKACERSFELTRTELETNALSILSLLTHLANRLETRGAGTLAVISSVAGDRGRQSNYVYGTAKGAVSLFLQGLRNRLSKSGVRVLTIKPGFVDSPMTADFAKGALWAKPEQIASGIARAVEKGRDVVYLPGFWRIIMLVIRAIPEGIFKRLSL